MVGLGDGVLLLSSAIGAGPTVVIHRLIIEDEPAPSVGQGD